MEDKEKKKIKNISISFKISLYYYSLPLKFFLK